MAAILPAPTLVDKHVAEIVKEVAQLLVEKIVIIHVGLIVQAIALVDVQEAVAMNAPQIALQVVD